MFCIDDNLCSRLIEIQIPESHGIKYAKEKRGKYTETNIREKNNNNK